MKRIVVLALALFGLMATAWAQESLADYAKKQREQQKPASPTTHVWTNDDIASSPSASAPAPAASSSDSKAASADKDKKDDKAAAKSPSDMSSEERAKAEADWKKKIGDQKAKVASLEHEAEIADRENKLRTISWYTTTSKALLDQKAWSDQQKKYEDEKADRDKKIADAKAELEKMRDDLHKAGFSSSLGD